MKNMQKPEEVQSHMKKVNIKQNPKKEEKMLMTLREEFSFVKKTPKKMRKSAKNFQQAQSGEAKACRNSYANKL
jgi:hypothetical protein